MSGNKVTFLIPTGSPKLSSRKGRTSYLRYYMEEAVAKIKQGNIHPLGVDRRVTVLHKHLTCYRTVYSVQYLGPERIIFSDQNSKARGNLMMI